MARQRAIGDATEARAQQLLASHGLRSIAHNYRCRGGEIDLIMRDGDTLVFVEVRYRRSDTFGGALASVDRRKQQRLIHAARHYLSTNAWQGPCRFDVVAFDGDAPGNWVADAFTGE